MDNICREIFRAIHEGKWLKIEYKNKNEKTTRYWISVVDLEPYTRVLKVDGLHLGCYTINRFKKNIYRLNNFSRSSGWKFL